MTPATPTPTPCPVLWRDTQAGRAERFHQEKMRQMLVLRQGQVVKQIERRA